MLTLASENRKATKLPGCKTQRLETHGTVAVRVRGDAETIASPRVDISVPNYCLESVAPATRNLQQPTQTSSKLGDYEVHV